MKILHVVALIQASTGGPAVSVTRLASEQAKLGHEVTLACLDYPHLGPQVAAPGVRVVSVKGNILAVRGRGWCPEFQRVLKEEAAKADVVHNHGLWMWPNAYARQAAVAAGKPLVISPRGMLEAWSLNRSKLRKAVAWWLFEKKNLQSAVMFHATAESEAESIRGAMSGVSVGRCLPSAAPHAVSQTRLSGAAEDGGRKGPGEQKTETLATELLPYRKLVVVAPNGVDLPDLARRPGREVLEDRFPELKDRRWVVFMSRLHPKKGVDVLLRAWARQKEVTCDVWRVTSARDTEARQDVEQGVTEGVSVGQCLPPAAPHAVSQTRLSRAVEGGGQRESGEQKTETPPYRNTETPHLGAVLVLAGSDLIGYRREVERMVRELGLEDSVVVTGEVQGKMKDALLANADVFVLPSYSENFGIVVAEAMAWGCPVVTTTGTPWKEVADVGAGWWVAPEEEPLAGALAEALGKRREELDAMGAKGRVLVERSYGWAAPAEKLIAAYEAALSIRH